MPWIKLPSPLPKRPRLHATWVTAAFFRKVGLAFITSCLSAEKSSIVRWVAASQVNDMGLCASTVGWVPNSNLTVDRKYPSCYTARGSAIGSG